MTRPSTITPTQQQLSDAEAELQRNPQLRTWLSRAGITLAEFAAAGERVRESLAEQRAARR